MRDGMAPTLPGGMYYELAARGRLKLNPENPKLITEEAVDKMVLLLQTHGFKDPVEAREEDGLVVAGHRRLLASDRIGLQLIPTIWHVGMTDDEAKAYTIAHTQAEAHVDWNRALLADQVAGLPEEFGPAVLGFGETDVARLFDLDRGAEDEVGDGAGDPDGEPRAKIIPGETWIIGPVTFKVFNNLDNAQLNNTEKAIRKIGKLLKCKPLLDGQEDRPLEAVLTERENGL